jgi:hypothetical protein
VASFKFNISLKIPPQALEKLSEACGFNFITGGDAGKPITWSLKAAMDLFSFARNEGMRIIAKSLGSVLFCEE